MKTTTPLPVYLNTRRVSKILAPYPTFTLPGSEARIQVMEWRYIHGYSIYHPQDIKDDIEVYRAYYNLDKILKNKSTRENNILVKV